MVAAGRATTARAKAGRAGKSGKSSTPGSPPEVASPPRNPRRMDIELLRVVAVLGVAIFHFASPNFQVVPHGYLGVDIFFTISGFVITAQMLRAHDRGALGYVSFLARRVRRLLPSAVLVIVATMVVVLIFANPVQAKEESKSAAAALLYVANFFFADQSVDYFAQDSESAFIHYWSLSVEEQFYVGWPIIVLLVAWFVRSRGGSFLKALGLLAAAGAVVSVVGGSLAMTSDPAQAFFMPWWRAHQLLLGAVVAIWLHARTPSIAVVGDRARTAVAAVRVACVLWLVALMIQEPITVDSPGWQALYVSVPVAVILGSAWATDRDQVTRLGALRSMAWIAAASYVIYLWHWPIWLLVKDRWPDLNGWLLILIALVVTFVLGALTHHLVEAPIRDGERIRAVPPGRVVLVGVSACAAAAVALLFLAPSIPEARVADWTTTLKPPLKVAAGDRAPAFFQGCFTEIGDDRVGVCRDGAPTSDTKVLLLGDSHAAQWQGALAQAAVGTGAQLVTTTKGSCSLWGVETPDRNNAAACESWRPKAFDLVRSEKPDVLVVSTDALLSLQDPTSSEAERLSSVEAGMRSTLAELTPLAGKVVVLLDTPLVAEDPIACLSTAGSADDCAFPNAEAVPEREVVERVAESIPGVTVANPYPVVCPATTCPVVSDNSVMFTDAAHLSNTFAKSLTPWLSEWLGKALAEARTS